MKKLLAMLVPAIYFLITGVAYAGPIDWASTQADKGAQKFMQLGVYTGKVFVVTFRDWRRLLARCG